MQNESAWPDAGEGGSQGVTVHTGATDKVWSAQQETALKQQASIRQGCFVFRGLKVKAQGSDGARNGTFAPNTPDVK